MTTQESMDDLKRRVADLEDDNRDLNSRLRRVERYLADGGRNPELEMSGSDRRHENTGRDANDLRREGG